MITVRLGRSGFTVNRLGFGALPLQRVSLDDAVRILRRAADSGINFFDTARVYRDSEAKLGAAFGDGIRQRVIIASKTMSDEPAAIEADITTSLNNLRTDYLDLYQFHNPKTVPMPDDGTNRYETMLALRRSGRIRSIGLTSHSLERAMIAARSGLYDTVQFPFSILATPEEEALTAACRDADVGFIAMKALGGGLLTNIPAAFAYTLRFDNVVPIWGIQFMRELEEFLTLDAASPAWDEAMEAAARSEREALGGKFCRGCGYCLPCPQDIFLPFVLRMKLLLRRSPWETFAQPEWIERMKTAKTCIECGACMARCPYGLKPPALLGENIEDYERFMREKGIPGF